MLRRPRFRPHLHVESVDGDGVFLFSEFGHRLLTGRLSRLVAPLIDGDRSVDEIVDLLREEVAPAQIYYTVDRLAAAGHLIENDGCLPEAEAALWSIQGLVAPAVAARLGETVVGVTALGGLPTHPIRAAMEMLHVRLGEPGDLGVVITDDYLRSELAAYNSESLATGRPWLLVKPVGTQIWVGPLMRPGHTGCWECLADRLRTNRQIESYVQARQGSIEPFPVARAHTPATLQIAWNLAAHEIAGWIGRRQSALLDGKVQTFNLLSWETRTHTLVQRPQCRACGDAEYRVRASFNPSSCGAAESPTSMVVTEWSVRRQLWSATDTM